MNSLKTTSVLLILLASLCACDSEMPSIAHLPGGASAAALRLPARKISQSESVKMAKTHGSRFGVDTALVLGVITQESGFNAHALSPVGAMGLMQLMPGTVKHIKSLSPVKIGSAYDPKQNVAAGTWYLKSLYNQFRGFPEAQRWQFALASYNGGIGRVSHAINKAASAKNKTRTQVTWSEISGYLPRETRNYVPAVMSHTAYYRRHLTRV
jgi:soluble lytic murein transglycosylase-like protein